MQPAADHVRGDAQVQRGASRKGLPREVKVAMVTTFIFATGTTTIIPHMQSRRDQLGCDALCHGSMLSLTAGCSLVGGVLLGRASDYFGRRPLLWVSLLGVLLARAINLGMDSLRGHFISGVVGALLNQNFGVTKALFCDYAGESPDTNQVDAVGNLGMIVGLALLVGPGLSVAFGCDYVQAMGLGSALVLLSALGLLSLRVPRVRTPSGAEDKLTRLRAFVTLPVLKARGAQALLLLRLCMALGFHLYMPLSQVSVRRRFNFGPADHAKTMGVIGLSYALSQGLIARPLIKACGPDSTRLLMLCMAILGGGRYPALTTTSVAVMYAWNTVIVTALGVANTAITIAVYGLVSSDEVGGFLGALEAVEQAAGVVGPVLGGWLAARWAPAGEHGTLGAVIGCYALGICVLGAFFRKHVFEAAASRTAVIVDRKAR